jgi:hypothetical protein
VLDVVTGSVPEVWYLNYRPSRVLVKVMQLQWIPVCILRSKAFLRHRPKRTFVNM